MCAFVEPTRQGTHLPQDSLRKKRSTFVPAASRFVPSAIDDQRAGAEHRARLLQRLPVQRDVEVLGAEEVRRGAAGLDRADLAARR